MTIKLMIINIIIIMFIKYRTDTHTELFIETDQTDENG